jgi:mannose-6-phosphate isomerase-like protein (cupin superfamily)
MTRRDELEAEAERAGLTNDALAELGVKLEPVRPSPGARDRLLDAAVVEGRLLRFADRVATLLDIDVAGAEALLDALHDPSVFAEEMPGISFCWVRGGAAVASSVRGFLRVRAGTAFPMHTHVGEERVLVMEGSFVEEDGTRRRPGDVVTMPPGSTHRYTVPEAGMDLLMLAIVDEAYVLDGERFGPR